MNPPPVPPGRVAEIAAEVGVAVADAARETAEVGRALDARDEANSVAVPPGPVPPEGEPACRNCRGADKCGCACHRSPDGKHPNPRVPAAAPAKAPLSADELARAAAKAREALVKWEGRWEKCWEHYIVALADQLAAAIRERDEQRGRAERAEAILADVSRRYGFVKQEADTRVAEAFRDGWRKGAEAMRAFLGDVVEDLSFWPPRDRKAEVARVLRFATLPTCPEGPPATKGDE